MFILNFGLYTSVKIVYEMVGCGELILVIYCVRKESENEVAKDSVIPWI